MNEKTGLSQLEVDNMIDMSINYSIISMLLKLKLITEKQYYKLKQEINKFY